MPSLPLWDSKVLPTSVERKYVIGSSLLTFFPSMTLTYLLFSIAPPLTSLCSTTHALSCSWEVLQVVGYDHPLILPTILFSLVFRPNGRPPSFNFQKARWDHFAFYFDSHCSSAEEYSHSFSFFCCCSLDFSDTKCG